MDMLLRSAEGNTIEITGQSIKAFYGWCNISGKIQIIYGITCNTPRPLQIDRDEQKAFKCRNLLIILKKCWEIKFSVDGNDIPTIQEKKL